MRSSRAGGARKQGDCPRSAKATAVRVIGCDAKQVLPKDHRVSAILSHRPQHSRKGGGAVSNDLKTFATRWARFRACVSLFLVAAAQFLSPAAAADPASKINPPEWSHRHSEKEIKAYGKTVAPRGTPTRSTAVLRESRLRRILKEQQVHRHPLGIERDDAFTATATPPPTAPPVPH